MVMNSEKIWETPRTLLTLLTEEDLPAMREMAREPDTFKYIKKLQILTETEYERFLQTKLEQIRDKTGYHWAVWLKDSSPSTGARSSDKTNDDPLSPETGKSSLPDRLNRIFIGAGNLNPIAGTPMMQIGCQLKKQYWQQGFASELTRRILDFGIGEAGLKAVYGVFEKENGASRQLLHRLGFTWQETKGSLGVELEIHKYSAP